MKSIINATLSCFALVLLLTITSCQKGSDVPASTQITVINAGFEDSTLNGWVVETSYVGIYGIQSSPDAVRTGKRGLNFYAAQPSHYPGAPQETPWNGKITQTLTGLKDGTYIYKVYADAVGTGMFLFANGGGTDIMQPFKSTINELNTLEFAVTGGTAKIGFICVNANGNESPFSPYFHADDVEFWTKGF